MQMDRRMIWTLVHTVAFCLLAPVSVLLILCGLEKHNGMFDLGVWLMSLCTIDPLGLILPIGGIRSGGSKWFYMACMLITTAVYWTAGFLVAPYF